MRPPKDDLSVTALYTSHAWSWGGLSRAELLETPQARIVFWVTNVALFLVGLVRWSLPSLRCSLLQRHVAIDKLLTEATPDRVIELAAGLSRRGAAFSERPSLHYVEVDLPHVIAHKRALLERSENGRAVLSRANFELVSGDVREVALAELAPRGQKLFVIAEGLFMYLQPGAQLALWSAIRALFRDEHGVFVFDLVPAKEQPPPGILGRFLEALLKLFTGGRTLERDERSREDIVRELRDAHFDDVEVVDTHAVAAKWSLPFPKARTQQLLFVCRT